jgi:hypothetical protein
MDYGNILAVLLGAGGSGALAGAVNIFNKLRKGKLDSEETLIARLNLDSRQQGERADKAEAELAAARAKFDNESGVLRQQRDRARDRAAQLRTQLIGTGAQDVPTLDDLYA